MKQILTALILFMAITCFGQANKFSDNYVTATSDSLNDGYTNAELIITVDQTGKYTRALPLDTLDKHYMLQSNGATAGTDLWLLADTIIIGAFSAIDSFNTSFIYGSFYNNGSDTLVVTEMMACLQGTTPSIAVDIEWHATLGSGSAVGLNATPPTITSVTTGDSDTTFDNAQIPPGVFVWLKTPTVTTAPTFMTVTLLGYRLNRTY